MNFSGNVQGSDAQASVGTAVAEVKPQRPQKNKASVSSVRASLSPAFATDSILAISSSDSESMAVVSQGVATMSASSTVASVSDGLSPQTHDPAPATPEH